jgi:hypothetical protein
MPSASALEGRARRAAERIGLLAVKSRCQQDLNHMGGFQLLDENFVIRGSYFELTAQDVLDYCTAPERLPERNPFRGAKARAFAAGHIDKHGNPTAKTAGVEGG